MKECIYDNPTTMNRELWRDGELLCSLSSAIIHATLMDWDGMPMPAKYLYNKSRWKTGQISGDPSAGGFNPFLTTEDRAAICGG